MTQNNLPEVNDFIKVNNLDCWLFVIAVDKEEGIWTCKKQSDDSIVTYNFDENSNAGEIITYDIIWPDNIESEISNSIDEEC